MSRSALTRVEMQQALASRATATTNPMVHAIYPGTAMMQVPVDPYYVEEARRVKENQLPIHGNQTTYNFNTLLYDNVMNSDYFRKLYELATYHEVVDEIYYRVDHAEPWAAGTSRIPSTCFCLLMKFCTMRLTVNQMQGLLKHVDSPFIRCVGFLYLRYTCDPELLWEWYEPFLDDEEEFNASSNDAILTTMGAWIRSLLEDLNYFNTILPRIPKKIQDGIKVKLLLHGQKKQRQAANLAIVEYLVKGTKVKAMYTDEDHPPAMYDAVIDEVDDVTHEYWVTFPEYGNTEKVSLGDIAFEKPAPPPSKSKRSRSISRSRDRHHHRSSRRRDRSTSRPRDRHRSSRRSPSEERSRHRHHRHARRGSSRSRSRSRERKYVVVMTRMRRDDDHVGMRRER
ncbi:hypothetical protein, variant [Aphanomyces astaci]|uniref:Pre-mRNA-splicing factor 38 n=1 Tax=Aphanomyces astaci TaxID=112090 RepID=W4GR42_APHAT|nr:hypothetical protein, variant [Aphanomyces astaci]ETV81479.1 hypothetical protein, variant [Aphanomyces astaci]|eukprot:XP_009829337.1 hypothetical protein, variant [Aphanomyces astaci]